METFAEFIETTKYTVEAVKLIIKSPIPFLTLIAYDPS